MMEKRAILARKAYRWKKKVDAMEFIQVFLSLFTNLEFTSHSPLLVTRWRRHCAPLEHSLVACR